MMSCPTITLKAIAAMTVVRFYFFALNTWLAAVGPAVVAFVATATARGCA